MVTYDNLLILRLRMPISDDLSDRNFITKISRYAKVGVRVWREGEGARGVFPLALPGALRRTAVHPVGVLACLFFRSEAYIFGL